MTATFTRTLCALGGIVVLASPVASQQQQQQQTSGEKDSRPAAAGRMAQANAPAARPQRRPPLPAQRPAGPQIEETFSRTVPLGSRGAFELSTAAAGDVVIIGVEGSTVRISATKRARHPNESVARTALQAVTTRVVERGGFIEALTEVTERTEVPVFVDYLVSVPSDANVSLRTFGGTLRVSNVRGELRADALAGDVALSGMSRIRNAKAFAGNLTISDSDAQDVNAETLGGTLQVRNVRARTIELSSVGGPILAADIQCDRCTMTSVSGPIELSGPLTAGGRYEMRSNSGDIRLYPTGSTGFDLEAITLPNRVRSEFPLKTDPTPRPGIRAFYGTYGDGGAILSLRTFGGSVSILRRDR
jgi:hypothetical protein